MKYARILVGTLAAGKGKELGARREILGAEGQEKRFGDIADEECKEEIDIFSCLSCSGVKLKEVHTNLMEGR